METEHSTGRPTKVVRETFYPDNNSTETVTIYLSPKGKVLASASSAAFSKTLSKSKNAGSGHSRHSKETSSAKRRLSTRDILFRIVIAVAVSLAATTLIIGIISWMLGRFVEAGVPLSSAAASSILNYGYIAVFLFMFASLFRSRLPLHRLLADLWTTSHTRDEMRNERAKMGPPPTVTPKYDRATSPQYLRELQEMKIGRGDLDAAAPPELDEASAQPSTSQSAERSEAPQPAPAETGKKKAAYAKKTAADKDAAQEKTQKAKTEARAEEARDNAQNTRKDAEPADIPSAENHETETTNSLQLERMILQKFANDVVRPTVDAMQNDPVTRRGGALVLAGAAAALIETSERGPGVDMELLGGALDAVGLNAGQSELFLSRYSDHVTDEDNRTLVDAGRAAMTSYLAGGSNIVTAVATALAGWRTPFGRPPEDLAQFDTARDEPAAAEGTSAPMDVYMLTEVRYLDPETEDLDEDRLDAMHDAAMGTHNARVRKILSSHHGSEITHTGKGIFAQFGSPDEAIDAAMSIQQHYAADNNAGVAISVLGRMSEEEDPSFSPTLSRYAQRLVAQAARGEILCEHRVRNATRHEDFRIQPADIASSSTSNKDESALFIIRPESIPGPRA
ncbi:MAG: hypothetical protein RLN70_11185, partial [Rhodospirillaceae bacterium]